MIFGYYGTSADSGYTDEVPADFAGEAFVDNEKLKPSWFWAVEDYWIDDVGAVICAGNSASTVVTRLHGLRKTWNARTGSDLYGWFAVQYHNG